MEVFNWLFFIRFLNIFRERFKGSLLGKCFGGIFNVGFLLLYMEDNVNSYDC